MPYANPNDPRALKSRRKWYRRNKERQLSYQAQRRQADREWLSEYKDNQPCADCGVRFPHWVLDFDHLPGSDKRGNLATMINEGFSRETILEEIAKCELVCANCHRTRTHTRRQRE